MININDSQLFEGLLGSIGWVLFFFYFRNRVELPLPIEGFLAWTFVWWLRKIGMNFYSDYKKRNKMKTKVFTII